VKTTCPTLTRCRYRTTPDASCRRPRCPRCRRPVDSALPVGTTCARCIAGDIELAARRAGKGYRHA
jgi:hypothetical protein